MALVFTTNDEILRFCGAGASAVITSVAATVTAIGENWEKRVCVDTRRDWLTGVASVNTNVKASVALAAAVGAAKEIANYDGSGYFSSLEQQTILDVLTDLYKQTIATLSQLDANSIRGVND
jgi:hypothetical protein